MALLSLTSECKSILRWKHTDVDFWILKTFLNKVKLSIMFLKVDSPEKLKINLKKTSVEFLLTKIKWIYLLKKYYLIMLCIQWTMCIKWKYSAICTLCFVLSILYCIFIMYKNYLALFKRSLFFFCEILLILTLKEYE